MDTPNVYFRGNSLLKLRQSGQGRKQIMGEIHYKFLLKPTVGKSPYVKIIEGKPCLKDTESLFLENLDIKQLKKSSEPYVGPEKTGVYEIIRANGNILDTEVGFSNPRSYVDFAALQETEQGVRMVFFEAKHFSNQNIRSIDGGHLEPEVIAQIERYKRLLKKHCNELIGSYRKVCCNLFCLKGIAEKYEKRHKILKSIVAESKKLCIDGNPRLVVFGFDCDQKNGKDWKCHRERLEKELGKCRVLVERDSKGFTRGISDQVY